MQRFFEFAKRALGQKKSASQPSDSATGSVPADSSKTQSASLPQAQIPATPQTLAVPQRGAQQTPVSPQILEPDQRHAAQHVLSAVAVNRNTSSTTLQIALVNRSTSSNVFAYVTGRASNNDNALFLLQSDGRTPYYPTQVASTGTALQANCAIRLGAPGSTLTVTIPQLAGARLWFSIDQTLTFLVNPGPALVEPSVTNPDDPNININWGFAEFTYNSSQIYANISYVDFVSIPISLSLTDGNGATRTVTGMSSTGFDQVCSQLVAQSQADNVSGWRNLIVQSNGKNLRVLSPNNHILLFPNDFQGYWEPYVDQVWQRYATPSCQTLTVRAENVNATGTIVNNQFNISGELFDRPSTRDIFSANDGPFTTGANGRRNQLIPQLAAAFNRSTLLITNITPAPVEAFYKNAITNHYSRIVHAANVDGIGYGFPYDDVEPPGGGDQSGYVSGANPRLLTVTVGGGQYT